MDIRDIFYGLLMGANLGEGLFDLYQGKWICILNLGVFIFMAVCLLIKDDSQ